MASLQKKLLVWLVPVLLVSAISASACTYVMWGWMVRTFMDSQLRVLADSHAASTSQAPALRPLSAQNVAQGDLIVQIWDRNGRLLTSSLPTLALPLQPQQGYRDVQSGSQRWRVYSLRTPDRTVQSVQNLHFRESVIRKQALQAGLPVALLIPISAVILWLGIRAALRRLELVARAAAAQDERTFDELPLEHVPSEIHPLVLAVNTLLARLRAAFALQRRFVQDAAHELRTPMTAMTLQLENLKTRATDPAMAEQVAQLEAGLARTKRLVEQLLRLARQEALRSPEAAASIQLAELLKAIVADLMPLADRRDIDLGLAAQISATVQANADELRSLVHNLLDNALRYTPQGGVVDVTLHHDAGIVTIEIIDSGPGIPPQLLPRVFDRFFRIEGSQSEGSGLGLAIAQSAAQRNHIGLALSNRHDGSGLIARLTFPDATVVHQSAAAGAVWMASEPASTPHEIA